MHSISFERIQHLKANCIFISLYFSWKLKTCKKKNPKRIKHHMHSKTMQKQCNSRIEQKTKYSKLFLLFFKKNFSAVCSCCLVYTMHWIFHLNFHSKKKRFSLLSTCVRTVRIQTKKSILIFTQNTPMKWSDTDRYTKNIYLNLFVKLELADYLFIYSFIHLPPWTM